MNSLTQQKIGSLWKVHKLRVCVPPPPPPPTHTHFLAPSYATAYPRQHKQIGPTSARYRQKGGRCSPDIADIGPTACLHISSTSARSAQCRLNVGSQYRPDIGNRTAGVHPTLPISARSRDCTEARSRPDVGNVGSMSEADIGPTCIPDIAFVLNY